LKWNTKKVRSSVLALKAVAGKNPSIEILKRSARGKNLLARNVGKAGDPR
jgi:hypothetical protein